MHPLIERHRVACDGFARIAETVTAWDAPTPCTEWDARALVEHVIGFHEVLILRPRGVRAHRPREGPAERWRATADALFGALDEPPDVLPALTTDVLVHTWDLARSADTDAHLDEAIVATSELFEMDRDAGFAGPIVAVPDDADAATKLIAWYGRNPRWTPPRGG